MLVWGLKDKDTNVRGTRGTHVDEGGAEPIKGDHHTRNGQIRRVPARGKDETGTVRSQRNNIQATKSQPKLVGETEPSIADSVM